MQKNGQGDGKLPISVVIVDDQALVRQGIRSMLVTEPRIRVVGEGESGRDAVLLAERLVPDVILLDIRMPVMDGLAAVRAITAARHGQNVIMLTLYQSQEYLRQAIRNGAAGYLLKDATRQEVIDAIVTVVEGGALIAPAMLRLLLLDMAAAPDADYHVALANDSLMVTPPNGILRAETSADMSVHDATYMRLQAVLETLTRREREVLALLGEGLSNRDIADQMYVSLNTVKSHVRAVLDKLDLADRTQAAIWAVRLGLSPERNRIGG